MLEVGKRYLSSRTGGWIQVTRRTPEQLQVERLIKPGTGRADAHLHRDPYMPGEGELVVRGSFDPVTDFIERYAEVWAHHLTNGTLNDQDEMPLLLIFAILSGDKNESYRAGIPIALQRASLPLLRRVVHLRGYRASYD